VNLQSHEKAAGVLDTPPTADTSIHNNILGAQDFERNELDVLCARFARKGFSLQRVYLTGDGHASFHVSRNSHALVFGHANDVRRCLSDKEESHGL
jgi:hypothetical protein